MSWAYRKDQEAPALTLTWKDYTGAVRDFSSGYTFTAKVALATAPTTIVLSKTTGITGAATAPNITVDWSTSDFSGLTADAAGTAYVVHLYARRTVDSKDAVFRPDSLPQFTLYAAAA